MKVLFQSTISRQAARLADLRALALTQRGEAKEIRITLIKEILLQTKNRCDCNVPRSKRV